MANAFATNNEYDIDEALHRWEKIKAEEAERKRQRAILINREALPYDENMVTEICERISCGELLINICLDDHLPTMRRCTQWLREHEDFNALYKDSLNDRLNIFEEEVIKIADDASRDFREVVRNGVKVRVLDGEAIARAKLRIEVRFRHLKAMRPARWGESTTLNVKSEDDPLGASGLSTEELERRLADLDDKNKIMRAA